MKRVVKARLLFVSGLIGFFFLGQIYASLISAVPKDAVTVMKLQKLATTILHLKQQGDKVPLDIEGFLTRKLCAESDCVDAWGRRFIIEHNSDGTVLVISKGDPSVGKTNSNITSRIVCRIKP